MRTPEYHNHTAPEGLKPASKTPRRRNGEAEGHRLGMCHP
nr:MAG TPA: hypothetical protein [Caudoviricetes sp.]